MAKFFIFPFGISGDRTAVPDETQPSGAVSYEQGWGPDYQEDITGGPPAKAFPRNENNQLLYDITDAIRQYQTHGVPDFIEPVDNDGVPYAYDIYARVRYDDGGGFEVYENQVAANTTDPTDPSWIPIGGKAIPAGVMFDYAGTGLPAGGYLLCDGSIVSRTTYAALFAAIGETWGAGDGSTTFKLPDFRGRSAIGSGGATSTATGGVATNTTGSYGGESAHTMALNEMHNHTHNPDIAGGFDIRVSSGGDSNFQGGTQNASRATTGGITSFGTQTPFNVYHPVAVVTKIIKT